MNIHEYGSLFATLVVGITFLLSGAAKLNDPRDFSYKIEEYLYVLAGQWSKHLRFFLPYTLFLAISIATLEVVLGTALLVHWQAYWTLIALLLLTLFFTGLTLYTATSSRIASCGCFGNAFELTPWQSFTKSVVLLLLISVIFWADGTETTVSTNHYWVAAALAGSLALSGYAIRHLPLLPLGPYRIGSRLAQLAQPRHPLRYLYVLEKDGQTIETEQYPKDSDYRCINAKLLNPEDEAPEADFSVWKDQEEVTSHLLLGLKLLIIVQSHKTVSEAEAQKLRSLTSNLPEALQPILISPDENHQDLAMALDLPIHTATPILLRTMLRAPMGLLLLRDGIVKGKWHYRDLAKAQRQLKHLGTLL